MRLKECWHIMVESLVMGHSERKGKNVYKNIYGDKEQNIFRNGIKFFK